MSSACPVRYQWTKDGALIANATNACLLLANVTPANAGEYCIRILGECASITNCARLTVFTNTVVNVTPPTCIPRGSNVTICPVITGTGPFTCQWTRIQLINGVLVTNVVANDCCLTLNNYTEALAGTYQITVTGRCNSDNETIALCPVIDAASIPITVQGQFPPATGACLGAPVTLCTPDFAFPGLTYLWYKNGALIAGANQRCVTTTLDVSPTVFTVVAAGCCPATNSITLGCEPCIRITKDANRPTVGPGSPVTYTYSVTNCGGLNLTNLKIVDDNGTPNTVADDFIVAQGVNLAVGEVKQYTFTKNAPILLCGEDGLTGLLEVMDLGDRFRAIFYQDPSVNNNAYGTSAAAFGWTRSHTFGNLTGSDKAEFTFRNGAGTIVLKAALDYISQSGSYPGGYGTLGVTGGDGGVTTGSAASVLGYTTSLTENLNKPPFQGNAGYLVNSPSPADPNLPLWENRMIYSLDVAKTAFGASGFGSVIISSQHNSPENGAPRPPCDFCITNVAVVTATATGINGPTTVTAMDDARVCINTNPSVCIDVTKLVACLLPGDACGTFGEVASGLKGDKDVGFCYSITVTNCGEVALTNVTVLDNKLGNLTTVFFPTPQTVFPVGGSVTRFVKMAWGANTTNTVTVNGRGATAGAPQVSATDSAVALVQVASLTCNSTVTSPCDQDGNAADAHVRLPTNNVPCTVDFGMVICNTGTVPMNNVTFHSPALAALGCTFPPPFSLAPGACFTYHCVVTLRCADAPVINDTTVTANADAGSLCAYDFDGQPMTFSTTCRSVVECGGTPCLQLIKTVDKPTAPLGTAVTYTYTATNCGGTTLTDITITDDNGTPGLLGDDFVVGTIPSLAPGAASSLTRTVTLPLQLCDDQTGVQSGMLVTEILPNGNIKATFIQDFGVNDNTYGVNSDAGWGTKGHTFKNLVGSDHAVFEFKNGQGTVVLEFGLDYISQITPTAQFPSGYRSLGVTGGDGDISVGSASSVLSWTTSLEQNLNKEPFLSNLAQYTVDSPAASDPNAPLWEHLMIYSVVVDKAAFGASGFGSVMITDQHNSPAKKAVSGPEPCSGCITNIATGTAISGGTTLTATAQATVCSGTSTNPPPSGSCPLKADAWAKKKSKQPQTWPAPYTPSQTIGSVFAKASLYPGTANNTLQQAVEGKGSSNKEVKELLKEAVAGLLNAASTTIAYPFSESDIIDGVNMVLMSGNKDNIKGLTELLKDANETKNCNQGGGGENCDTAGKPNVLSFQYNGQSCAAAHNAQMAISGKTSCSGDAGGAATVRIIATSSSTPPTATSDRFFDGMVNLNQQFEVHAGSSRFGANTYLYIYDGGNLVQSIQIHTSCSAPLVRGDSFGALVLIDYRIEP